MIRSVDCGTRWRRSRTFLAVLLALLLAAMQHETLRHALSHLRPAVAQEQIGKAPADAPCAECALLAAGSSAPSRVATFRAIVAGSYVAPLHAFVSPAPATPAFYRSRAPPSLS